MPSECQDKQDIFVKHYAPLSKML